MEFDKESFERLIRVETLVGEMHTQLSVRCTDHAARLVKLEASENKRAGMASVLGFFSGALAVVGEHLLWRK